MTVRAPAVSSLDIELLRQIGSTSSVVAAAQALGISRDRANYHLRRLTRAFRGPVVTAERGGAGHGRSLLTPLGDRVAHGGFNVLERLGARGASEPANRLAGVYRAGPPPSVEVGSSLALRVAFRAADGERVALVLDPEAIVVSRGRFESSARNVVPATVESVGPGTGPFGRRLRVRAGRTRLTVALTREPIRTLGLTPGRRVYLYVKATALRRVGRTPSPSRGSLPS